MERYHKPKLKTAGELETSAAWSQVVDVVKSYRMRRYGRTLCMGTLREKEYPAWDRGAVYGLIDAIPQDGVLRIAAQAGQAATWRIQVKHTGEMPGHKGDDSDRPMAWQYADELVKLMRRRVVWYPPLPSGEASIDAWLDWREMMIQQGHNITYGDVADLSKYKEQSLRNRAYVRRRTEDDV